jgi:hypothetical protein
MIWEGFIVTILIRLILYISDIAPIISLPQSPPPPHTQIAPVLESWFSILIFKWMFKGVSQCMPIVGVLYFDLFNPFHYSPLPLYLPTPIFQQISMHILISSTFTSYVRA